MEYVIPCQTDNAIKVFALAFEFAVHIQEDAVRKSIKIHSEDEELQEELPRTQLQDSITVNVGSSNNSISKTGVNGVTFDCLTKKGDQEWAIVIRPDAFIITCSKYTCWADFYTRAKKYISKLLPALGDIKISALGIECVDEFNVIVPGDENWKPQLFDFNSKFLPRNIVELNDSWHSFHGFFEKGHLPNSKTLNNVDITYTYQPESKSLLVIKGRHITHLYEIEEMKALVSKECIDDVFSVNHDKNKDILKCLLSNEMLEKIKLGGKLC